MSESTGCVSPVSECTGSEFPEPPVSESPMFFVPNCPVLPGSTERSLPGSSDRILSASPVSSFFEFSELTPSGSPECSFSEFSELFGFSEPVFSGLSVPELPEFPLTKSSVPELPGVLVIPESAAQMQELPTQPAPETTVNPPPPLFYYYYYLHFSRGTSLSSCGPLFLPPPQTRTLHNPVCSWPESCLTLIFLLLFLFLLYLSVSVCLPQPTFQFPVLLPYFPGLFFWDVRTRPLGGGDSDCFLTLPLCLTLGNSDC